MENLLVINIHRVTHAVHHRITDTCIATAKIIVTVTCVLIAILTSVAYQ